MLLELGEGAEALLLRGGGLVGSELAEIPLRVGVDHAGIGRGCALQLLAQFGEFRLDMGQDGGECLGLLLELLALLGQVLHLVGVIDGLAHGGADLCGGDAVAVDREDAVAGCVCGWCRAVGCRWGRALIEPQRLGDGVVAVGRGGGLRLSWLRCGLCGRCVRPLGCSRYRRRRRPCAASWRRLAASMRPASERLMAS